MDLMRYTDQIPSSIKHTHGKLLSRSNSMQMFCAWLCLCGDLHLNSENYEEHARPPVANSCNATNQS